MARIFNVKKSELLGDDLLKLEESTTQEETIDLKDVLNRTVAFDGHTLDDNDADLITSLLEGLIKNKNKD